MVGLSAQNSKAGMRAQGWIFGIFFVLLAWRFNSEWPVEGKPCGNLEA